MYVPADFIITSRITWTLKVSNLSDEKYFTLSLNLKLTEASVMRESTPPATSLANYIVARLI